MSETASAAVEASASSSERAERWQFLTPPNALSLSRIALLPWLWWCAIEGRGGLLGLGILLAGATDVADGWLARKLHRSTKLGARLDSLADNLLIASVLAWLWLVVPEVRAGTRSWILWIGLASWTAFLSIGIVKFGRLANLHLWSAKLAAVVFCAFAVTAFAVGFAFWLYLLAIGCWIGCNVEGALVLLTRDRVDEHIGSILRLRAGSAQPSSARCS